VNWATTNTVRSALTVLAFALVVSASVAAPVFGQATPAPTPAENGSDETAGTDYPVQTLVPGGEENGSGANESSTANGATTEGPGAGVPAATNTSTNGSESGSGGGGLGFGVPSASDLAGEAANGTISTFNSILAKTIGPVFRLPWAIITVRFAPLEATGYGEGLWARPPGLFGQLYDAAMNLFTEFALLFLVLIFVIDWFGNLSPNPRTQGVTDRVWRRAGDVLHLLFSWPIAWAHFLLSSMVCLAFMPSNPQVIGDLSDYWAQLASVGPLAGFVFLTGPLLVIVVIYLFAKQFGAFIYMLIGIVAYPFLVVMGMSDHWLLGRLGEYAENAREGFVVAAWYPVPTAFILGIGYWIDEAVLNAFTLGGPIGEVGLGALFYPLLWLAALYAPLKVFQNGNPARHAKSAALAVGAGGAAGATTGATAGSAAGSASAIAAGSGAGAAGALPAGAGAGATSAGAGSVASTTSRMASGSPGASAIADGGTMPATGSGDGGAGPLGGSGPSAGTGATSGLGGSASSTAQEPDGLTRIGSRDELDTGQRYEPVVQRDSGSIEKLGPEPPNDANWLVDQGGADRLSQGTDEPLYFRGESDGELYDLRGAANAGGVHGESAGAGGSSGNKDSIRNL
jgi:hypothetical protein